MMNLLNKPIKRYAFLLFALSGLVLGAIESEDNERRYVSYRAVSNEALKQYEPDYRSFKGIQISDKLVYFKQRKVEEAIVQKDYIVYHLDRDTKELVDIRMNWRVDVPGKLPRIISRDQAESMVEGEVRFSQLYYIAPDSNVCPIRPVPENPCWIIETVNDDITNATIVDAVKGKILGPAVPPPSYTAFTMSGPIECDPMSEAWDSWYENAEYWFDTMGYDTDSVRWPIEDKVKSHIQSDKTVLFYEIAHGGSYSFKNDCSGYVYATEIETWIADYTKMPFTFVASCDGMCYTGNNTFSYEFRKGSNTNTTTVGYCGMSGSPCVDECWYGNYTISWQTALFSSMNQGWSVKAAFDEANAQYPACGINNCMRFAGDGLFAVVPMVNRGYDAGNLSPKDGAWGVVDNVILEWTTGADAVSHDVYFGTDFNDVNDANNSWPVASGPNDANVYKGNFALEVTSYEINNLEPDTYYYWRIDEPNNYNPTRPHKGEVWMFTTRKIVTVPDDYPGIQAAIDLAPDGGTIIVKLGRYYENIDFLGKAINLRSTDPNNFAVVLSTIIDANNSDAVVTFKNNEGSDSIITGFTITDGNGYSGGGIYCNSTTPTIIRNIIKDNTATYGGGLYRCNGDIINCLIINNNTTDSSANGGGLYRCNGNIVNCTVADNSASYRGGGLYDCDGTIKNCIIWGNTAENSGAQLYSGSVPTYCCVQGGSSGTGCISSDPYFADTSNSNYYLKSQRGRWDQNSETWIEDTVTSPCIDAGAPSSDWTAELWPHGKRINMGTYGGTRQASMSLSTIGNIADLNNDDSVNYDDVILFTDKWLEEETLLTEDLDRNGFIDLLDYAIFANNWLWQE